MLKIGVRIDNREVKKLLNDAIRRGRDMRPAFEAVGETVRASVMKNFEVGGRPKSWEKSKKAEGKTLIKSGILAGSIKAKAYNNRAEIGTNVPYAAIHHAGGTIKAHEVKARKGGALRIPIAGGFAFRKKAWIPQVTMPARPFLLVQDEDWREIEATVLDHITGE